MKLARQRPTVVFLSILVVVVISAAHASETRVLSMGGIGLYTRDNSNIQSFPGTLVDYRNQVITELRIKDREDQFTAGVNLPFGDKAVVGVYLNRPLAFARTSDRVQLTHVNDFLVGARLGDNRISGRLSLGFDTFDEAVPDTLTGDNLEEDSRYYEFALGFSNNLIDIGLSGGLPFIELTRGDLFSKIDGFGYGINARAFFGNPKGIQYVPVVVFNDLSTKQEATSGLAGQERIEIDFKQQNFGAGVGVHYQVDSKNLVILAVEAYGYSRNEREPQDGLQSRVTRRTFPGFFLGGETHPNSWLILRVGAAHVSQELETVLVPQIGERTVESRRESQFNVTLGAGFQLGKFLADIQINEHQLFEGPDFISGSGSRDFITRISVTYAF